MGVPHGRGRRYRHEPPETPPFEILAAPYSPTPVAALRPEADPPIDVLSLADALPAEHYLWSPVRAAALAYLRSRLPSLDRIELDPTDTAQTIAGLCNDLAIERGRAGDRPGALAAIQEAVTLYRRLAEANPAAFTPDLAASLHNLANRLSETGDRQGALAVFDTHALAVSNEPGCMALILVAKTRFLLGSNDLSGATRTLAEAARSAQASEFTPSLGRARAELREVFDPLEPLTGPSAEALRDALPTWAWLPLDDEVYELLNGWQPVAGSSSEAEFVEAHRHRLFTDAFAREVDVIEQLHGPSAFLDHARAVIKAGLDEGAQPVIERLRASAEATDIAREWMATPTWAASELHLQHHLDELRQPHVRESLDPQHTVILELTNQMSISAVYELVMSPPDAALAVLDAVTEDDDAQAVRIAAAAPTFADAPNAGPVALASLFAALQHDQPTGLVEFLQTTLDPDARPLLRQRLSRLTECRPELASRLAPIVAVIEVEP
ncbi:MAG: hypothetical protein ACK5RL_21020 [Acidimicrobiales bacterium]